jgi:hypothetical protein
MSLRLLVLLGVSLPTLACCSGQPEAIDCFARFADTGRTFPAVTSAITASYVFDGADRGKDPEFLKTVRLQAVVGNATSEVAEFERRDFEQDPSMLLTSEASLIGVSRPVDDAADAVRQGCALEARYGTLRNVRLTSVNPTFSTKNER